MTTSPSTDRAPTRRRRWRSLAVAVAAALLAVTALPAAADHATNPSEKLHALGHSPHPAEFFGPPADQRQVSSDIAFWGKYAVHGNYDGFRIVDVSAPGNPKLVVTDIAAVAEIAHAHGAQLSVDNTFMSPILQRPLEHGADLVVHSMTKFLNGHADVVAGMVIAKDEEAYLHLRKMSNAFGGTS